MLNTRILLSLIAIIIILTTMACETDREPNVTPVGTQAPTVTPGVTPLPTPISPTAMPGPTATSTSLPSPTPIPQPTAMVTLTTELAGMTVAEYAATMCESADESQFENITWGEYRDILREVMDRIDDVQPPAELKDYHQANLALGQAVDAFVMNQDQGAELNNLAFTEDASVLMLEITLGEIQRNMSGATRALLLEYGCIGESLPTPEPVRENRQTTVPFGVTAVVKNEESTGYWGVTVMATIPDATKIVLDENPLNDPPEDGSQFYIVRVRAMYLGPDSTQFNGSYRLRVLGDSGVVYSTFENSCGVTPDSLPDPELFTNGTVEGNECWEIASADADSLMMFLEPYSSYLGGSRPWFSLKE